MDNMERTAEQQKLITFFDGMAEGKVPYNANMYYVDDYTPTEEKEQEGAAAPPIQIVSPTQQQVEQAKVHLKRKLVMRLPPAKKRRVTKKKRAKPKKTKATQKKKPKKTKTKAKRKKTKAKRPKIARRKPKKRAQKGARRSKGRPVSRW